MALSFRPESERSDAASSVSGLVEAAPRLLPGLSAAAAVVAVAWVAASAVPALSPLVLAVLGGMVLGNLAGASSDLTAGLRFAARTLLRVGIVLLGLRLSLGDLVALGGAGIAVVVATVTATFFGTQWIGRRLGLSRDLSLLVATGYSICGASAIAAMDGTVEADEEEVAASIGLVTLFGSLAIVVLPALAGPLGLSGEAFGSWVGASTHDVAQVVAAASTGGSVALSAAIVVKLTRIALLAPIVAGTSLHRRRTDAATGDRRPPLLPGFVIGFLAAVALRSTGVLSSSFVEGAKVVEGLVLAVAMVGLGAGVRIARLRRLGWTPLVLGAVAWALVAGAAYAGVTLLG